MMEKGEKGGNKVEKQGKREQNDGKRGVRAIKELGNKSIKR